MSEIDKDPELTDNPEEGVGDEDAYENVDVDYDHSQFELPDDYEDAGDEDE